MREIVDAESASFSATCLMVRPVWSRSWRSSRASRRWLPVSRPGAGGQQPRPTPTPVRLEPRGVAVDAVQATLGEMLLVLAGLAVVLLAVILVLVEST